MNYDKDFAYWVQDNAERIGSMFDSRSNPSVDKEVMELFTEGDNMYGKFPLAMFLLSFCDVNIFNYLTTLDDDYRDLRYLFLNCTDLTSFEIPDGVKVIPSYTFTGCTRLTDVHLPQSVQFIGDRAFAGTAIDKFVAPQNLKALGMAAFQQCEALNEVSFNSDFKQIGVSTFWGCWNLKHITLPDSIEYIPSNLFRRCGIEEFYCPSHSEFIGEEAFRTCQYLKKLVVNEGCKSIGKYAFDNCPSLNLLELPQSLRSVDADIISAKSSILKIKVHGLTKDDAIDFITNQVKGAKTIKARIIKYLV